ncbi:ABC transporter permease [Agaribacter flavus]|uniref:ABC transporter permease n=1 Tax=Agaribacter flavus TaxID=1902781 RepID=A0ABV7FM20_9ALTE
MNGFFWVKTSALFFACLLVLPLVSVVSSLFSPDLATWQHLIDTVLADYVVNSIGLAFGSASGAIFIGSGAGYIMANYRFKGKVVVQICLLLPLAMPAYIIAYTYTGLMDFGSPFQQFIQATFGLAKNTRVLPDIRNLAGAIVMLSLVLYPYVYLLSYAAFKSQPTSLKQVSTLAGRSKYSHFFLIAVPIARPAILTGGALVMMEALADYGTVAYFGVNTFSTGIYRTWFGMGNREVAAQLASALCLFVFLVLFLEKHARKDARRYQNNTKSKHTAKQLTGKAVVLVTAVCMLPPLFGFFIPTSQLFIWAFFNSNADTTGFASLLGNTLYVSLVAAIIIVALAMLFSTLARYANKSFYNRIIQVLSLGYALPGLVVAVGVISVSGWLDRQINIFSMAWLDTRPGLVISGSITILVFAYAVRYLSVALQNTETGYARMPRQMDTAALSLHHKRSALFTRIHLPLMQSSVLSALLLVFVDVLKELPATLVLRPFNFNTLAVKAHELASDERLIDAALPAIAIVGIGLLPVCLLIYQLERSKT